MYDEFLQTSSRGGALQVPTLKPLKALDMQSSEGRRWRKVVRTQVKAVVSGSSFFSSHDKVGTWEQTVALTWEFPKTRVPYLGSL